MKANAGKRSLLLVSAGFGVLVLATLCLVAAVFFGATTPNANSSAIAFDSVAWKAQASGGSIPATNVRDRMVKDLLESNNFQSWMLPRIVSILGTPDADIPKGLGRIIRYYLGVGSDYLAFELDANGVVNAYYVIRP